MKQILFIVYLLFQGAILSCQTISEQSQIVDTLFSLYGSVEKQPEYVWQILDYTSKKYTKKDFENDEKIYREVKLYFKLCNLNRDLIKELTILNKEYNKEPSDDKYIISKFQEIIINYNKIRTLLDKLTDNFWFEYSYSLELESRKALLKNLEQYIAIQQVYLLKHKNRMTNE